MNETVETAEKIESEAGSTPAPVEQTAQAQQSETPETIEESSLLNSDMTEEAKETEEKKEPEKEAGAPEKYEDFKAPQGVSLDADVVKGFSEVAKELNLPQDKAQAVIDKVTPILAQKQADQIAQTNKAWQEKVKSDPVIGGDHLKSTIATAQKALKDFRGADGKFVDEDVAELAAIAGNHPGLIKILKHFGSVIGEDRSPAAKSNAVKQVLTATDFYKAKE
ncbi:hypothetical protein [Parasutterella excrementihominis]|uniref:hypothetical protein n=1 Tax=Parasutterella excrementihominis TaxID=487175 RepID=UPI00248C84FB|nr:hypothetical protein [Parasutterella excrementihominis]